MRSDEVYGTDSYFISSQGFNKMSIQKRYVTDVLITKKYLCAALAAELFIILAIIKILKMNDTYSPCISLCSRQELSSIIDIRYFIKRKVNKWHVSKRNDL